MSPSQNDFADLKASFQRIQHQAKTLINNIRDGLSWISRTRASTDDSYAIELTSDGRNEALEMLRQHEAILADYPTESLSGHEERLVKSSMLMTELLVNLLGVQQTQAFADVFKETFPNLS